MIPVSIRNETATIGIEVIRYENPMAGDPSDANWLSCRVDILVPPFQGRFDTALTTRDFLRFRNDLDLAMARMKGKASLVAEEEGICVEIDLAKTGKVKASGQSKMLGTTRVHLTFGFETDQSFLQSTLRALNEVVQHFPLRS
jgi:hypothetical protein